jgi:hypothetical protein
MKLKYDQYMLNSQAYMNTVDRYDTKNFVDHFASL